jgi:hypothetical protein
MDPQPDYGEHTYEGTGKLKNKVGIGSAAGLHSCLPPAPAHRLNRGMEIVLPSAPC